MAQNGKKYEVTTGLEPRTSQIPVRRSNYWRTERYLSTRSWVRIMFRNQSSSLSHARGDILSLSFINRAAIYHLSFPTTRKLLVLHLKELFSEHFLRSSDRHNGSRVSSQDKLSVHDVQWSGTWLSVWWSWCHGAWVWSLSYRQQCGVRLVCSVLYTDFEKPWNQDGKVEINTGLSRDEG